MDTTPHTRITTLALVATILWTVVTSTQPTTLTSLSPSLTVEQQDLVVWAMDRFVANGLDLPPIETEFSPSTIDCMGHKGLYYAAERRLHMCAMDKRTMLHELAHAWANVALSKADRQRFVELRGLNTWNDRGEAWKERGTEHAAETIAWALMDEPIHVRWVEDGIESFRLLTIPDSDVNSLAAGFEALTSFDSPYRHASEVQAQSAGFSPEASLRR